MPNRLSKILSRSAKEKEAEAEKERNNSNGNGSSPPPAYSQEAQDYDRDNVLQPPDMTAGFSKLKLDDESNKSKTPQVDQTIAHLKVLECFYRLRQKVGSSDGLFGLEDSIVLDKGLSKSDKTPENLAKLSEKRWAIYVSRAVDRFSVWLAAVLPNTEVLTRQELVEIGSQGRLCDATPENAPLRFDKQNMPPVDVLMVWHAYMLNPRDYLEDCLRFGRMSLWHAIFPWEGAVNCINSNTFVYESAEAAETFAGLTGLPWDQLDDLTPKKLSCPACLKNMEVQWTTCPQVALGSMDKQYDSWTRLSEALDEVLSEGDGYCDKTFAAQCPSCQSTIDHDSLRADKFCVDVKRLMNDDMPMAGTILGNMGVPIKYGPVTDYMYKHTNKLPNVVLKGFIGRKIVDEMSVPDASARHSMEEVRDIIEDGLKDKSNMRSARSTLSSTLSRGEKMSIRKMMTKYWDNSSPFALDLVGAVIRQGSFVEKMHNIDWLHSPALPSTMSRLIIKYLRFVKIMSDPIHMAVPTLDVDLAWHTHQLSPPNYMDYTVHTTRQFIDHDDKIAETKLNDSFAWTSKTYQKTFGEPYSECTCWYCEAIRESHTSGASRMFGGKSAKAEDQLHNSEQDPRKSVHISTHNAVRPDDATYNATAARKAKELEKEYQKACERARKKGRKEPKRDDYYYSDAWGEYFLTFLQNQPLSFLQDTRCTYQHTAPTLAFILTLTAGCITQPWQVAWLSEQVRQAIVVLALAEGLLERVEGLEQLVQEVLEQVSGLSTLSSER